MKKPCLEKQGGRGRRYIKPQSCIGSLYLSQHQESDYYKELCLYLMLSHSMKSHILPARLVLMSFIYFSFKSKHKTKMSFYLFLLIYNFHCFFPLQHEMQSFGDLYLTVPTVMIYFFKDNDVIIFSKSLNVFFQL